MTNSTPVVKRSMMRRVWRLTAPYWGRSGEPRWAWSLLITVIALALFLVWMNVQFNNWNREFYEAIQEKDIDSFWPLIRTFSILATVLIAASVLRLFLTQWLEMRWRTWLTRRFMAAWLDHQSYYRMELQDRGTDNPDQRIADDLRIYTSNTLSLTLGLLSSTVTLFTFITILWTISGPITFPTRWNTRDDSRLHGVGSDCLFARGQHPDPSCGPEADPVEL